MEKVVTKLEAKDYWEWRTTIAEMQLAQVRYEKEAFKFESMSKDVEIQRLRLSLYKSSLDNVKAMSDLAKKEYDSFKSQLETKLGVSLNNSVIDDVTFEVIHIEENKET